MLQRTGTDTLNTTNHNEGIEVKVAYVPKYKLVGACLSRNWTPALENASNVDNTINTHKGPILKGYSDVVRSIVV